MNKNITGADLPDDCKTLILAVGGSSKGLGAAGIDADQELARTDALISAAKEKGIIVLALHTGGSLVAVPYLTALSLRLSRAAMLLS